MAAREWRGPLAEAHSHLVPKLTEGADPGSLRLDPLTTRILELVDGERSAPAIASLLEAPESEVEGRLRALGQAKIVSLASKLIEEEPLSEPPPATPGLAQLKNDGAFKGPEGVRPKRGFDPSEKWSGVERGSLEGRAGKEILDEAGRSSFTGSVKLAMDEDTVTVYFEQGTPTGVQSTAPRHEYGRMLHKAGHLDEDKLKTYQAAMERGAPNPLSALHQAGIESKKDLARLIVWRGGTILAEIGAWDRGTYTLSPGSSVPAKIPRCRLKALHRPKIKWRDAQLTQAQLDYLDKNLNRYLVPGAEARGVVSAMNLDSKEARFVEHVLSKPLQLREAMTISTLFRGTTRKILYRLIDTAAVEVHETNPDGAATVGLDDLESFCKSLERDNDFNVLAIHPTSSQDEIRQRFEKRLTQFDEVRYSHAKEVHREWLTRIRERINRAWEAVRDPQRRREHVQSIYSQDQLDTFFDLQLKKAEMALKMRQNPAQALELSLSALQLRPSSQEALLALAGAQAALGQTAKARSNLKKIRAVPPRLRQDLEQLRRALGA